MESWVLSLSENPHTRAGPANLCVLVVSISAGDVQVKLTLSFLLFLEGLRRGHTSAT